jgi:bifunctional DNA-binding transcriptional regulator/antitoxin component of YhaV-PrlF toxin-antitoxin module
MQNERPDSIVLLRYIEATCSSMWWVEKCCSRADLQDFFTAPQLFLGNKQDLTSLIALPMIKYYYLSITHKQVITMRVTSKGQVTIPQNVRENMGILPAETEIEFQQDENGRWYINKTQSSKKKASRFRTAHKAGNLTMSTDDIMALTRG